MRKKAKFEHPRLLSEELQKTPCFPETGDEIFCNGVFYFNITARMHAD